MRQRAGGKRRATVAVLASVIALILTGCTPYANAGTKLPDQVAGSFSADVKGRLDAAVTDAMTQSGSSAAMVGVWAPWAGSWVAGKGTTAVKGGTKVTPDMSFRIAENTMPMTCTVLLGLVDDGTVKLDDQVLKYLPGFVGVDGVTLRELCQNTSGLGDYGPILNRIFVNNPTRQWPALELASDGIAAPAVGKPGEKFGLAATNYILLGMALENASGSSWQELYKKYIFSRLGMSSTYLPASSDLTLTGAHPVGYATAIDASGHAICGTVTDVSALSPSMGWTAFGAVSTVSDLKSFSQALATGSLLSKQSAKAQVDGISVGAAWREYGLGVSMLGPMRGSVGAIPGYLSAAFSDPVSGLTVVVALNNSSSGEVFIQSLAQRLISIAAKAPAKQKGAKVVAGLPWSEEQAVAELKRSTVCAPAAAPAK
ncbi:serine hydrolase domain-containing protein [Leifsonia sp. NPDC058292]|uniref:serine hydrolase domain-containing protein n=1 Tax=Leifsonia sp. NPDC058292 TaxID=3346428 RepID=UPI0036D921D6